MTRCRRSRRRCAAPMRRCWWRRRAPARPRGCRWSLAQEPWAAGKKIIVLEPRRLAARAAAARMAATLGETVGETVGYRVRFGSKVSRRTRIEVVTEGVFTRMMLDDPSLDGVAALLFDEFHERSLDADLGLALARDVQTRLARGPAAPGDVGDPRRRAGGEAARRCAGDRRAKAAPSRSRPAISAAIRARRSSAQVADAVARALRAEPGIGAGVPAGRRRNPPRRDHAARARRRSGGRHRAALTARSTPTCRTAPSRRRRPGRRKVVLATSIAETSLTIEGVRIVIDCGLARVPRYEPDVGADAARNRARVARVGRPAPRPRRPHRAGRLLPAVGRAADRFARGRPTRRKFSRPICRAWCSTSRIGASPIRRRSPSSIRRRAPALDRGEGAADGARRDRWRRPHHRRGPAAARSCRCRRGSRAWWSTPRRRARRALAADIAAAAHRARARRQRRRPAHRLDALRRDRSPRARRTRAPWRSAGRRLSKRRAAEDRRRTLVAWRAAGARLSRPHRQEPRRGRRVPACEWPRRQCRSGVAAGARSRSSPSPRSPARAAQGAHPARRRR